MKEQILAHLPQEHPWRDRIGWYGSLDSTNDHAKALAASGAPEGTVVIADHQTSGRGRLGRCFHSPAGAGIYMTVILRPHCPPTELMHLTCAAGVAVCDGVQSALGFRPGIKWINDLVADRRKLGGILTELSIDPKTGLTDFALVGIGLNCDQTDFPPELRPIACSAAMLTGRPTDRACLSAQLIVALERMCRELRHKDPIMSAYRKDCVTLGKQITVIRGDVRREGTAVGIGPDGALLVRYSDGETGYVDSGEASVRGLFGYT